MKKILVIALGGNAILQRDERGTFEEQMNNVKHAMAQVAEIISRFREYQVVLSHGGGPQVGNVLLQQDAGNTLYGIPPQPMHVCAAMAYSQIGYMMQQTLTNELKMRGVDTPVATILTQTVVDINDPACKKPSKPVGPFYDETTAKEMAIKMGWSVIEDAGRGWRRIVASPEPKDIVEKEIIRALVARGFTIIAAGGGGIPVIRENEMIRGVDAVIDKDLGAEKLAEIVEAEVLMILTDVNGAALRYGSSEEAWLGEVSLKELKRYYEEGHFKSGSMGPKVLAAIKFLEHGGKRVVIASLDMAVDALKGKTGTQIVPGGV